MSDDEEYPPLLSEGFHVMSLDQLKSMVVDNFPLSERREPHWANFLILVSKLQECRLRCRIWVDGSFLTEKINPKDIDLVFEIPIEVLDGANEVQLEMINQLKVQAFKRTEKLHSFVFFPAPADNDDHLVGEEARAQWTRDFGRSYVKREPKGIAVIEVHP